MGEKRSEERELDWDEPIRNVSGFVELPEGDYDFVIDHLDRARSQGEGKLPPCKMAVVYFDVTAPDGSVARIKENYLLHTSLEWKLAELFKGAGLMREDEKEIPAKWHLLPGCTGRAKVTLVPGYKDPSKKYNKIDMLYPKKLNGFKPGAFS